MVVKKKVVKKRVAKLDSNRIENINIIKYFRDGEREVTDDNVYIIGNVLYCYINFNSPPENGVPAAIKVDGYTLINGDSVVDTDDSFEEAIDNLQTHGTNEITTSFKCLENAGVDMQKMRVLEISEDLSKVIRGREKGFKDFEKNIPQGATYTTYKEADGTVYYKKYHRAGCLLFREGKKSYLCGMDENSYFVTKLPSNPKTIADAFKVLKPKVIQTWEKKNGAAMRQGEWFFIPYDGKKPVGMRRKGLPLLRAGGNKHMANRLVTVDGKHIVSGDIDHIDHDATRLGDKLHQAVISTALDSWSEEGVD